MEAGIEMAPIIANTGYQTASDPISAEASAIEEVHPPSLHADPNASQKKTRRFSVMHLASSRRHKERKEVNQEIADAFAHRLKRRERFLIRRSDFCKHAWDTVLLFTTMTLLFLVPIQWSFLSSFIRPCHNDGDSFTGLEEFATMRITSLSIICVCSMILIVEMFLSFFTPVFDSSLSLEVIRLNEIADHYLRFYCWKDVLAAFPWSLCFFFVQPDLVSMSELKCTADSLMILKYFEIIMLLRFPFLIIRFLQRLHECAEHWQMRYEILSAIQAFLILMICLNLMACLWNMIGEIGDYDGFSNNFKHSWSTAYIGDTMRYNGLSGFSHYYMSSFYYATMTCTTIGYGDVTAQNTVERIASSIFMIIGAALYGYVTGIIVNVVETSGEPNKIYYQCVDTMNDLMRVKRTPKRISRDIRAFLANSRNLYQERQRTDVLSQLSPVLRARMCECMYGESIRKIRCFRDAPKAFVGELGAVLKPEAFAAMEPLIRRHEISGESNMYIITEGLVGSKSCTLRTGDVVGEDIICQHISRSYEAFTLTHVHTLTLSSDDLRKILKRDEFQDLRKHARKTSLWIALKALISDMGTRIKRVKQYAEKLSDQLAMETGGKFIIDIVVEIDPDHLFIPSESGTGKVVFEPGVMMQELKNLKLMLFDSFQAQEIIPPKYIWRPKIPDESLQHNNLLPRTTRDISERMLTGLEHLESIVRQIEYTVTL